ncbi:MAG: UbiA family prenyltransferase [Planctomycetota bacterium]|nr:UbiA family prenyltransferase [Planctomycetota bacterium]
MMAKCRAWLDLLRVSNIPTCLSNVLVGWAIGGAPDRIGTLIWIAGVICIIYLAGMVLNDVADAPWDRRHRPDRPIPRGIIRRSTAGIVGGVLLFGATGVTVLLGPAVFTATAVLAALVLVYDAAHRVWPVAILGMALCRAMVYLVVAIAATEAPPSAALLGSMLALGLWTAGLTLIARRESEGQAMRWPLILLVLAVPIALWIGGGNLPLILLTGILLLLQILWIATKLLQPTGVVPAVLASIAGISLLDAFILGILNVPLYAVIAVCCFVVVTIVHRPLPGT